MGHTAPTDVLWPGEMRYSFGMRVLKTAVAGSMPVKAACVKLLEYAFDGHDCFMDR